MTILDLPDVTSGDRTPASCPGCNRSPTAISADDVAPTVIPVAWMGRTSTDDQQDPTLSLPRQLDNRRRALPAPFVIVAKFYDIESGRNDLELRGQGDAHERFDIPIARDGGIADLLAEAKRPDRRFVAVVCESIERVARVSYFSTKIEYELDQVGVALLAADEGIKPDTVLRAGGERPKQATQILTRRVKQAISEWYVVNMLELSWDGVDGAHPAGLEHRQAALRLRRRTPSAPGEGQARRRQGEDPTRARPGPRPGRHPDLPVAGAGTARRTGHRRSAQRRPRPVPAAAADPRQGPTRRRRLDQDLRARHPRQPEVHRLHGLEPAQAVPSRAPRSRQGQPAQRMGLVAAPDPRTARHQGDLRRGDPGRRLRQGSRGGAGPNAAHRQTKRSYLLRSYLVCDLCDRRMFGKTRVRCGQETIYYACITNPEHHQDQPWYPQHAKNITVREDHLLPVVSTFFGERILGPQRALYLNHRQPPSDDDDGGLAAQAGGPSQTT